LTLKFRRKKYGPGHGELILIHLCTECSRLSINRIAADDDPEIVFNNFEKSFRLGVQTQTRLDMTGIRAIPFAEGATVRTQLFGQESSLAGILSSNVVTT
jgi:hypothetical protein